jgi:hypothetical protein
MKTSVELQDTFSYMPIWLILVLVLVAGVIFMQIFFRIKFGDKLKRPKKIRVKKVPPKTLAEIRLKYLGEMNMIEDDLRGRRISIRKAYNRMSTCIRGFVFEATGIPVDKYTLAEIKQVGIPALTQLVAEYYEPEFARFTYADINQSMYKTRKVLELWR